MPKFDLDINGIDEGFAEGFDVWSGPTPPAGAYRGKVKVAQIVVIDPDGTRKSKYAGQNRVKIGVELSGNTGELAKYNGFMAWGGFNLVESGKPFINQFLHALTDGTDEEFDKIKQSFYGGGLIVDDKKVNITDIGRWNVASPDGELPIGVRLKHTTNTTTDDETGEKKTRTRVEANSFLSLDGAASSAGTGPTTTNAVAVEADDPDEDYSDFADDETEATDLDGSDDAGEIDMSDVDESIFDEPEGVPAN